MLEFKLEGDILQVKETSIGWHDTRISYWHYDVKNWIDNANGKREPLDKKMSHEQIDWVKKFYLPLVSAKSPYWNTSMGGMPK
jgi:hypothetical protein